MRRLVLALGLSTKFLVKANDEFDFPEEFDCTCSHGKPAKWFYPISAVDTYNLSSTQAELTCSRGVNNPDCHVTRDPEITGLPRLRHLCIHNLNVVDYDDNYDPPRPYWNESKAIEYFVTEIGWNPFRDCYGTSSKLNS